MISSERTPWAQLSDLLNEHVVAALRVVAARSDRPPSPRPFDVPSDNYLQRRAVAKRLSAALDGLRRAFGDAPEDLLQAVAGAAPHLSSGTLSDWLLDLDELCDTTRDLFNIQRGKRGSPVNLRKRNIENGTAHVLKAHGFRLTKARDGMLSQVLMLMYEATNEHVPADMMPILQRLIPKRTGALNPRSPKAI